MQILRFLVVYAGLSCVNSWCQNIKQCKCTMKKSRNTEVSCSGVHLDSKTLCGICGSISNVSQLDLSETGFADVPTGCFEECHHLEELSLASNEIRHLNTGVFQGLQTLMSLDLSNNTIFDGGLSSLEVFEPLSNLQVMNIRNNTKMNGKENNYTSRIVCNLCDILEKLQYLDISENDLSPIPPLCFEKCQALQKLSLVSNGIHNLTNSSFQGLSSLRILDLGNNTLISNGTFSEPGIFLYLPMLQELYLQKNSYDLSTSSQNRYLPNIINGTLTNLQTLFLDGLPNAVFGTNFRSLKNLTLLSFSGENSYCNIIRLSNITFQNVPYIHNLNLSFCKISSIEAGTFEPLSKLRHLNLSYNMALGFVTLRNVSYGLQFTRIEILDYSKVYKTFGLTTQLNRCDCWFLQNTTLKEIHLNSNRMASIETDVFALFPVTVEVVFAEDNRLSFGLFALQLGCAENVIRAELSRQDTAHAITAYKTEWDIQEKYSNISGGCEVTADTHLRPHCQFLNNKPPSIYLFSLPPNLISLRSRSSNLRYEPLPIPFPFPLRNKIESIDLSNNIIYIWKEPMVSFNVLKNLNLSNNFCSYVSGDFFLSCPYLENFDASHNKIGQSLGSDEEGSIFKHLTHLKVLNVSNNWIDTIPISAFKHLGALELLDMSFNQIENLNIKLDHMVNLSMLFLRQNKLSTIPMEILEQLDQYSKTHENNATIDLTNNQLEATCGNIKFLTWLIDHSHYFTNIDEYTFIQDGLTRITYQELSSSFNKFQKGCIQYTAIFVISSIFLVTFVSVVIGGMIYRFRWRLRYFYYMTKARYGGYIPVRDTDIEREYKYDVFISYANENYRFATGEMYETLSSAGLSLCLHQKDFLPGNYIAENILKAIKDSRITLILLSPAFLESKWCIYEFNMARMESIYSRGGDNVVFVVMYEDIDMNQISPEMRECLESESYLAFPEDEEERVYFWQTLKKVLCGENIYELQ